MCSVLTADTSTHLIDQCSFQKNCLTADPRSSSYLTDRCSFTALIKPWCAEELLRKLLKRVHATSAGSARWARIGLRLVILLQPGQQDGTQRGLVGGVTSSCKHMCSGSPSARPSAQTASRAAAFWHLAHLTVPCTASGCRCRSRLHGHGGRRRCRLRQVAHDRRQLGIRQAQRLQLRGTVE